MVELQARRMPHAACDRQVRNLSAHARVCMKCTLIRALDRSVARHKGRCDTDDIVSETLSAYSAADVDITDAFRHCRKCPACAFEGSYPVLVRRHMRRCRAFREVIAIAHFDRAVEARVHTPGPPVPFVSLESSNAVGSDALRNFIRMSPETAVVKYIRERIFGAEGRRGSVRVEKMSDKIVHFYRGCDSELGEVWDAMAVDEAMSVLVDAAHEALNMAYIEFDVDDSAFAKYFDSMNKTDAPGRATRDVYDRVVIKVMCVLFNNRRCT